MFEAIRGPLTAVGRLLLCTIFLLAALGNKIPHFNDVASFMASAGVPAPRLLLVGAIVFLIASVAVSIGLIAYVVTHHNPPAVDAILGLILGGTIGNGYDRIMYGTVTDFIALHFWPVFNVADSAVSVGVVLIALGYFVRAQPRAA